MLAIEYRFKIHTHILIGASWERFICKSCNYYAYNPKLNHLALDLDFIHLSRYYDEIIND